MVESKKETIRDDYEIINILETAKNTRVNLWLWQLDKNQERVVHFGRIRSTDRFKKTGIIVPVFSSDDENQKFNFSLDHEIYIYYKEKNIVGKLEARKWSNEGGFSFKFPSTMNKLYGDEIKLFEQDNEEKCKHLRTVPRKKAQGIQMVKIANLSRSREIKEDLYELYDLSQGGMAFWTFDPGLFVKGDDICMSELNNKPLPNEFKGKVVAVRTVQEEGNRLKICIKFN